MAMETKLANFLNLYRNAADKGVLLLIACIAAMTIANTPFAPMYYGLKNLEVGGVTFLHFTNDLLMALFFLIVGLEIKRELIIGNLATNKQRMVPVIAAVMGVIVPVLIFYAFNYQSPTAMRGWAIPAATDIAFALGMLSLFGQGLPVSYRVFLAALAIIDDLIAIMIIALFYSNGVVWEYVAMIVVLCFVVRFLLKKNRMETIMLVLLGSVMWFCFLKSSIHTSICGVVLAMLIPIDHRLFHAMEKNLVNPVQFAILPLFAFLNSGVAISLDDVQNLSGVFLGCMFGLFIGKQLGVLLAVWGCVRLGLLKLAKGETLVRYYGVGILCGIGFTMSIFVASLAYPQGSDYLAEAKLGVLAASFLSAVFGGFILKLRPR